jgi:Phage integrase family
MVPSAQLAGENWLHVTTSVLFWSAAAPAASGDMTPKAVRAMDETAASEATENDFDINIPKINQTGIMMAQSEQVGKPFTAAGFGNWFRDRCREAELPERCTSHGLRKAAATYLAELGFTDHQLMAWFGWTSISQAQACTKAANRKRMARDGAKLTSGTGIGSPSDPVSQNEPQEIDIARSGK